MNINAQQLEINVYGRRVSSMELAFMTHLSQTTVYRWLRRLGFYDGNAAAAEDFCREHGLNDLTAVENRLKKIRLEHPDYYIEKPKAGVPLFKFSTEKPKKDEKKPKRMTYTQELQALGFEPWPSDYELEARGER